MAEQIQRQGDHLRVGLVQTAPVWLDREATLDRIGAHLTAAAQQGCDLVAFGEALLPGYPFWIEHTDGARFNSPMQKDLHARYLDQAVQIEAGHLDPLCAVAARTQTAVYVGCVERPTDRGGHSLYCALVFIGADGGIGSVHRKLMPTHEERLTWSPGDGHGLRTHRVGAFTVGGLNCWENWMPLSRAALYGLGEDLHVAVWPGSARNTHDITRFIARESRSYVISVSGLMRREGIPMDIPHRETIVAGCPEVLADGGSCLAGPDGEWIVEPLPAEETTRLVTIDHREVRRERQNFDPAGHYARPDVIRIKVNRARQSIVTTSD